MRWEYIRRCRRSRRNVCTLAILQHAWLTMDTIMMMSNLLPFYPISDRKAAAAVAMTTDDSHICIGKPKSTAVVMTSFVHFNKNNTDPFNEYNISTMRLLSLNIYRFWIKRITAQGKQQTTQSVIEHCRASISHSTASN